jgi:transposase
MILAIMFRPFDFIAPKTLSYLSFQSFDFERSWWWLFQKHVVCTKFDIYVFIKQ